MANNDFTYEIKEHLGVLSESKNGFAKELSIVSWNGGVPKFDIRDWSEDHTRMTRGITLFDEEAKALMEALSEYFKRADK